jgi:hypothetical protein
MVAPNTGVLTDALASRPRTLEPVKENNGIDTYYIEFGGGLAPRTLVRDIGAPPPLRIGDWVRVDERRCVSSQRARRFSIGGIGFLPLDLVVRRTKA